MPLAELDNQRQKHVDSEVRQSGGTGICGRAAAISESIRVCGTL
jgi:hypothetical protein